MFSKFNIVGTILIFIALLILMLEIKYYKKNNKYTIIVLFISIFTYGTLIISSDKSNIYSSYNLYFKIQNNNENVKKFGLLTSVELDIFKNMFKVQETFNNYSFERVCNNDKVCEISNYLVNKEKRQTNNYTGIFEGKNLIIFLAESFYPLGVDVTRTPTLYKLIHEGFEFNNYYTPMFLIGTADSQYMLDTSLLPSDATWTMENSINNYYIYSYPKVLKDYKSFSYHNYDYDFYKRDKYMENMGYETYLACGNGLEKRMNCNLKQNSDLEMVKSTINDYISEEKFLVYYTTMSGHAPYTKDSDMVAKNYQNVKNLKYSEEIKYYMATQIELDRALEYLIEQLEKNHKLEDTVILLSGDHPPYTIKYSEIMDASKYNSQDELSYYKSNLIIYNSTLRHQIIEKPISPLDVLPSMLNLFNIDYDSRLLMGKDIFSNDKGFVIFNNRSFIYGSVAYNSPTGQIYNGKLSNKQLKEINEIIYEKFHYSRLILETNYYYQLDKKQ